jgi:hypothetical protein
VLGTTPGHEVWTFEDGWTVAAGLEEGDRFMGRHGQALEITGIHLDPTPTAVYNFEIDGTYTYFVDGVWVHNNSCNIELHHAWPKFLGGKDSGLLVGLPDDLHEEFHKILTARLKSQGLKLSGLKNDSWTKLLNTKKKKAKAYEALTEACDQFDQENGTMLLTILHRAVAAQR